MYEQPPRSLIKQPTSILSEREHAGRQTSVDTKLPLVRRNSGGENGVHEYPPYPRSEATSQYPGNCRESLDVYSSSGFWFVRSFFLFFFSFFFFFFTEPPFVTFIVGDGFSIRLRED